MAQGTVQQYKTITCGVCGYERTYRTKSGKPYPEKSTYHEIQACKVLVEGAASAYTPRTLTLSGAGWTPDAWKDKLARVIAHDGKVQDTRVISNTEDTLVLRHVLRGNGWPSRPPQDPLFKPGELPTFQIIDEKLVPTKADIKVKLWDNNSFICVCGAQQDDIDT